MIEGIWKSFAMKHSQLIVIRRHEHVIYPMMDKSERPQVHGEVIHPPIEKK